QFAEKIALGLLYEIASIVEVAQAISQARGQVVQLIEERLGFESGIVNRRQIECGKVQPRGVALAGKQLAQMGHSASTAIISRRPRWFGLLSLSPPAQGSGIPRRSVAAGREPAARPEGWETACWPRFSPSSSSCIRAI